MKVSHLYLLLALLFLGCSAHSGLTPQMTYEEKILQWSLKHLVSKDQLSALLKMEPSERDEWLSQFWKSKDPTPATEKNEFKEEHQRRVKYALENFGSGTENKFWDDRGEVYIIYGEPEEKEMGVSKSWSSQYNSAVHPESPSSSGRDVSSNPSQDTKAEKGPGSGKYKGLDLTPVTTKRLTTPQDQPPTEGSLESSNITYGEVWHYYTHQLTFQFEDRKSTGFYGLVPFTDVLGKTQSIQEFSMEKVTKVDNQTMLYEYDYQAKPFDYALDLLRFKGKDNSYNLDVNLGLPLRNMGLGGIDSDQVKILRRISVLDDRLNTLTSDSAIFSKKVDRGQSKDQLIIDQQTYRLNPGEYTLAVQIEDLNGQKAGVYKKKFIIPGYVIPGAQEISPLLLASLIRPAYPGETKFVKHGYVIVPMPSKVYYPDQFIYLYYEVYNLKKDNDGKSRYTVHYSLVDYKKRREIAFYEPKTFEADTTDIIQTAKLDASTIPPGEYALAVRATDINRGKDKVTLTGFKIVAK